MNSRNAARARARNAPPKSIWHDAFWFTFYCVCFAGGMNWLLIGAEYRNAIMMIIGVFPASWVVTIPVGFYALFFGPPDWVRFLFD